MSRKKISIVAIALVVFAGWYFFIFCRTEMNVMTFNILYNSHKVSEGITSWQNRQPVLINCLEKRMPDILGTQESFEFQTDAIRTAFPHWQVFGQGRYYNIPAVNPRRPFEDMGGESCRILYNTTEFELLEQGTFWHSDFPDSSGSKPWGNELPRVSTWGVFKVKFCHKKFLIMNTHFHWGEPYVQNTTKLIMQKWREIGKGMPTILMGDFNLPPDSYTHELFCGRVGPEELRGNFRDCWQLLNKPETGAGTSHSFTGKGENRIDWILVTPEFTVKSMEIIPDHVNGCYPSDHFPVMAKISF